MDDLMKQLDELAEETAQSSERVEKVFNQARDIKLQKELADLALNDLAQGNKQPSVIEADLGDKTLEMVEAEKEELESQNRATEEAEAEEHKKDIADSGV